MSIETKWISYGDNDLYQGYLARPQQAKGPLPVIIVYQEIWGVDEHIMDVTRRLASAGYAAFAPDLYARSGQRQETHEQSRIESVKAFLETMPPTGWHDPDARQQALSDRPEAEQKQILDTFSALFPSTSAHLYADQIEATVHFLQDTCLSLCNQVRLNSNKPPARAEGFFSVSKKSNFTNASSR